MAIRRLTIVTLLLLMCLSSRAQVAKRFDVLITEIFADPTPVIGLPPSEFIELKNVSAIAFNLKDWKIADNNSTATIQVNFILQPDSIVVICPTSAAAAFSVFGTTIGVSNFPSLDNDGDVIQLRSKENRTIHAISYGELWYRNDLKASGGWSLEMIDTRNPCGSSSNWKASNEPSGGTPARTNSAAALLKDEDVPRLVRTYSLDSTKIVAVFDEQVDSSSSSDPSKYELRTPPSTPVTATARNPLCSEVILKFLKPLSGEMVYDLAVREVEDCIGNKMSTTYSVKAGLPSIPLQSDVVINEVLFNPKGGGYDFFEIVNRSNKIFDLQNLYVANRNATGGLQTPVRLSEIPHLLFPGHFLAFTLEPEWLRQNYFLKNSGDILKLPSFPSLPDDKGTLLILDKHGVPLDELSYDSKWHFALIDNEEGITLERIDPDAATQDRLNWTSAASTSGYGTPGYQNSQFKASPQLQGVISTDVKTFSPDNDGIDDLVTIHYKMTEPGFVANITIFDSNGRRVRHLARNSTLALEGLFRWDGLDDTLKPLPIGIYVMFTEIFNLKGRTKKFKNVITLTRRLR